MTSNMTSNPKEPLRPLKKSDIGPPTNFRHIIVCGQMVAQMVAHMEPRSGAASTSPPPRQAKRRAPPPPCTLASPPPGHVRPAPPPPSTNPPLVSAEEHASWTLLPSASRCLDDGDVSTPNNEEAAEHVLFHTGGAIVSGPRIPNENNNDTSDTGKQFEFLYDEKFDHEDLEERKTCSRRDFGESSESVRDIDASSEFEGVTLRTKKQTAWTDHCYEARATNGEESWDDVDGSDDDLGQTTRPNDGRDSTYEAFSALDEAISAHSHEDAMTVDTPVTSSRHVVVPNHATPTPIPAPRRLAPTISSATTIPPPSDTPNRTAPIPVTRKAVPLASRELESVSGITSKTPEDTTSNINRCAGDGTNTHNSDGGLTDQLKTETIDGTNTYDCDGELSDRLKPETLEESFQDYKVITAASVSGTESTSLPVAREVLQGNDTEDDAATERGTVRPQDKAAEGGEEVIDGEKLNWDPKKCFTLDDVVDPEMRLLFENAGVTDEELRDADTRRFIHRFLLDHGGMEAVKREAHFKATLRLVKRKPRTQAPREYLPRSNHHTYL